MFIPTINTGGREAPFSTPLGREANSLMGYPLSFYEGVQKNKQTNNLHHEVGTRSYKNTGRSNAAWVRIKKWFAGLRPAVEGYMEDSTALCP